jgi:hypothetical protein
MTPRSRTDRLEDSHNILCCIFSVVVFGPGLFVFGTRSLLDKRLQQLQATRTTTAMTAAMAKNKMTTTSRTGSLKLLLAAAVVLAFLCGSTSRTVQALSLQSSVFHGRSLVTSSPSYSGSTTSSTGITMRKQKASDRRTRKRQRGEIEDERMEAVGSLSTTLTTSPMSAAGPWNHKQSSASVSTMERQAPSLLQQQLKATGAGAAQSVYGNSGDYASTPNTGTAAPARKRTPGRGRSRKRSTLYNSLAFYHNKFLILLTDEYQAEVRFFRYYR